MELYTTESIEDFTFDLPSLDQTLEQDEEYFTLKKNGIEKKLRFHDYSEIYQVKGLYEKLFYEELKCKSPKVIANLLKQEIVKESETLNDKRILDFGAGNGMVAEELSEKGAEYVVGMDLLPEAKSAAMRDRKDCYTDYYTMDCCNLSNQEKETLEDHSFDSMVTVAALGFGDIPPKAFAEAFNTMENGGWCAFNIRDKYMEDKNTKFKPILDKLMNESLDIKTQKKYTHRLAIGGEELKYYALVGKKITDAQIAH